MQLHNYLRTYICIEVTIYIHLSVNNIETLEWSQTLCECLIILVPVFKLNSHDAPAYYHNHHGQNELNHG